MNAPLGDFLRSRRARLRPADVGIAATGRRRVPGLRREEVARLAGLGTDCYVRLERGRGRQVSRTVLDALGRALRLDPTELAHLHDLARPPQVTAGHRQPIRDSVRHLLDGMRDVPAIVVDHRMVIVAANSLGVAVFGLTDDPATWDPARQLFLGPHARTLFPDWLADARTVTAELRLRVARHPDDRWLTSLIGELSIKSEEFRKLWAGDEVRETSHGRKRLNHAVVGELTFTYERLALADDEQSLLAYTADPGSPTAERLALLASWTAEDTRD